MKFTFADRLEGFDEHIRNSIRGYDDLLSDIVNIGSYFIQDNHAVVDIGCSSGKLLKILIDQSEFSLFSSFVGVELEESFYPDLDILSKDNSRLSFYKGSIANYQFPKTSLVMSIFTLQFLSPSDRQGVVSRIYDSLAPNGAFIFSEKTVSDSSRIQDIRNSIYYQHKLKNFSAQDILQKEHQLRYMMHPNTRGELFQLCQNAGFQCSNIDSFWQNHAFTAFIALKS